MRWLTQDCWGASSEWLWVSSNEAVDYYVTPTMEENQDLGRPENGLAEAIHWVQER